MKDSTQIDIHRIFLICGTMMIPLFLSGVIYSAIDCDKLTDKGYAMWIKDNPGKSFKDFKDSCNILHPLPFVLFGPLSPIMGFVAWQTTRSKSTKESK